ncbi:Vacuolar protein sorting-associated protein 20 [Lithohypha guttulata]|uniref:Vacuolar protein sorting-associated protein 20 n=1 Tax=Lithohypha guttulata TaxID=1690604 RepID=UPI002DDFA32A|nr:Vacuolar protein sorting-associated protein 20 [Lithohypha guttulata]KAK5104098.1 Vacuolar protein sorting-associated protein 20 [Lithohypha guttulata]
MGNSGSKISSQDRAILDMKNQRDKLKQYQKKITVITNREKEIARVCLAKGEKDKALLALRRKKFQESLLSQTDAQLEQLEKLTSNVEFSLVQKDVVFGLQRGTEVLKMINKEMGGLAAVEKMMEEGAEARREQEEISEALAGQLSNQEEDEVEDELEALEIEMNGVSLPDAPNKTVITDGDLPNAPETELDREQKQKERAKQRRAQLQAA